MMPGHSWQNAEKILCVRPDNMGDILMTTSAMRALRSLNPRVHLTLLASRMGANIAHFIPEVDEVIEFDVPWVRLEGQGEGGEAVFDLIERLKRERFDAAVIFTVFSQNPLPAALICYLADIPLRLGYCRENPYALLTDWVPDREPFEPPMHEVQRQLALVDHIGARTTETGLSLNVVPSMRDEAITALERAEVDTQRPWIVLHPGVSEKRRQYPADRFAEAARELTRRGFQIVVTGSKSEHALAQQVARAIGESAFPLAGQLSLAGLIGLIDLAPLLISNNTGPVHIAAAVGTPVVVLYAHTNPQHTPWHAPHRVLYFDVPPGMRSRNVLIEYTYRQTVRQPVRDATPGDIAEAALALIATSKEPADAAMVSERS